MYTVSSFLLHPYRLRLQRNFSHGGTINQSIKNSTWLPHSWTKDGNVSWMTPSTHFSRLLLCCVTFISQLYLPLPTPATRISPTHESLLERLVYCVFLLSRRITLLGRCSPFSLGPSLFPELHPYPNHTGVSVFPVSSKLHHSLPLSPDPARSLRPSPG